MSREIFKDLLDLKGMVDLSIGNMIATYNVANVSTFFIYQDISDYTIDTGDADDQPDFFKAVEIYMGAIEWVDDGNGTNCRLVASLTNGQEIILHQVGDFSLPDPEPDPDNEKAHRDWRTRQGT